MGQITVSKCYTEDGVEIEGLKVIEPKLFERIFLRGL